MQTECGLEAVDITDSNRTSNRILPTRVRGMICRLDALALGKPATIEQQPEQTGDVRETFADLERASRELGYRPATSFRAGLARYIQWYRPHSG